jgi:apolipoprotein N-acyltransferase
VSRVRGTLERSGLVALGVGLDTLSMPPGPVPALVFAADAPFLWLLWHRGGERWKRWAFLYGWVRFAVGLRWLVEVHWAQVVLAPALLAVTVLLWGGAIRWLARRGAPFPLAVALTAVLQEMAQAHAVVSSGMPWPCRSLAFTAWEPLTAASCELGAYGLSFLAALSSAWVSGLPAALRPSPWRRVHAARLVSAGIPVLLLLGAATWRGSVRVGSVDARIASGEAFTTRPLVIVQAAIPQSLKHPTDEAVGAEQEVLSRHVDLTRRALEELHDHRVDPLAVLWPETMIPFPFLDPALAVRFPSEWQSESNVIGHLASAVPRGMSARYLVGVNHYFRGKTGDHERLGEYDCHDSLLFLDASEATSAPIVPDPGNPLWTPPWEMPDGRHDKVILVPWGEYTPLGGVFPPLEGIRRLVAEIPEIAPGDPDQRPFLVEWAPPRRPGLDSRRVMAGTVICFELAFPARCREWRQAGATILLNAGNYGWFGDTGMPAQVTALAKLRAAELNVTVAIAGNTGPSQIVDPAGRVTAQVLVDGKTHHVQGTCAGPLWSDADYRTTYVVLGDAPWLAGGVVLFAWALLRGRRRGGDEAVTGDSRAPTGLSTGGAPSDGSGASP